ncbi:MAG: CRTAC1 family protein, partial [Saprospiraceae bacterium]
MPTRYLLLLVLFPWCLFAQAPFIRITDPSNPATTFPGNAAPYKGLAWVDLDGDNRTDLFVSQRYLFHNDGNGHFTQLTNVNGAQGGQGAGGSSWGDLDNDGDPDGITTSVNSGFHQNNGDNTFTLLNADIPDFAGYSAWDCALADADNNGRLDAVFVHACCTFHPTGPFPCKLYLQSQNGGFTPVTGYEFTDTTAAYTIPAWFDYDQDGDMDLFIGSGPANGTPKPDFNYRNLLKETGAFGLERLTTFPFAEPQDGQTYNLMDYDNDGDLDICLTNYAAAPNRFYRNDGGAYTSINTPFTKVGQHLANCWGDVNNDGYLDVLITTDGSPIINLYYNQKDGSFANAAVASTAGANVCGIAMADYDNDGQLDFYTNGANEARGLFHNQLTINQHWAQFTLQGTTSNRSAIGAEIRVKAMLDGGATWQLRQVVAHNSFQSQNDLRQHFGLNDALQIDSVSVRWPSGLVETFSVL